MSLITEYRAEFLFCSAREGRLAEMYLNFLGAGFVRDYDLFWHIASATRNFALRARGLITSS